MNGKPHVMVVDDDLSMCNFLRSFLADRGYYAITMGNAEEAVKRYHAERPAAVILDVVMPGAMDGLAALAAFKKIDRDVPIIVLSGQGRTTTVVQAMKLGATDFVCKPFDETDLEVPLNNALKQRQLSREVATLREQLQSQAHNNMLFGHSERMAEVRDLIDRVADTDVTVLVRGESGTGKELVARALYASSLRRDKPFVKVNCAALPTELLESELFGFERGAFTGAIQHKPGKFEFANHGTMFLDEIGDMSFALQAKLLQVLQDGEFSRLGGKHDVHVDVRVLAATNQDLEQAVAEGKFREDLFFRLNVVTIHLPPLRDRREEIPILTEYFLKKYSVQYNKPTSDISQDTMRLFMDYDWPGNVRELENLIKRAVVLASETLIRKEISHGLAMAAQRVTNRRAAAAAAGRPPQVIPHPSSIGVAQPANGHGVAAAAAPAGAPVHLTPAAFAIASAEAGNYSLKDISREAARQAERELILKMLQHTRWNRKETAEILGISYKALLYKIKENGLDKAS
ncbi:MAG TPA: sigma-54 dependent transcriptional regulator [Vicinamibacterales bacterium]|nr:sigma-54 dependent transcriptional regulator [Vicinamibacterales bacterium]